MEIITKESTCLLERKHVNFVKVILHNGKKACKLYARTPVYYMKGNLYTIKKETCILYERKPIYYMKGNLYTI